ncbi:hypothetical protein [Leptothoe sp. PORK10 BA2]|uniref:hypothetical protein n=1 Tax=Leptothoe sp. PORK10 BA2 TaxID=3110254 RepID=UPI002B1F997A|nr:hypothetical protein [Leptothoe sp. PORK10 BA2]MEA5464619.1 hypothetical protein [Leptothoe sp. PORK10 BA2]
MQNSADLFTQKQQLKQKLDQLIENYDPSGAALLNMVTDMAESYPALQHVAELLAVACSQMRILEHRHELLNKHGIPIE